MRGCWSFWLNGWCNQLSVGIVRIWKLLTRNGVSQEEVERASRSLSDVTPLWQFVMKNWLKLFFSASSPFLSDDSLFFFSLFRKFSLRSTIIVSASFFFPSSSSLGESFAPIIRLNSLCLMWEKALCGDQFGRLTTEASLSRFNDGTFYFQVATRELLNLIFLILIARP